LLNGRRMRLAYLALFGAPALGLAILAAPGRSSSAPQDDEAARMRCATRLSLSLTGKSPDDALLANPDPQAEVGALLESPEFVEQFSRFMNSQLNPEPGDLVTRDATYFLARHVLENHRPWHEVFDGPYDVTGDGNGGAMVVDDPNGLGYFRSRPWMVRYAGNEEKGLRLVAAYRMQQNIIGLDVAAVTNAPDVDISATGRMASGCAGCHYDSYFALDKVARILSRKSGPADNPTFIAPLGPPQQILGNQTIANDKELVAALVASTDHSFNTCRLAFKYLYGRAEANCEAPLFDKCIDAYTQTNDIRAALETIATDASFCE
jgi:hypothetical protein